jgi:hypothetical protein
MIRQYPEGTELPNSLQSRLFGHRMKPNQTLYEYLIEFLQVMLSEKQIVEGTPKSKDLFPVMPEVAVRGIQSYTVQTGMAFKRFVFFPNGKIDSKAPVDQKAYEAYLVALKKGMEDMHSEQEKSKCVAIIQNLLYGFSAANQNRAWFFQNMLPVCPEMILPEGAGEKKNRNLIYSEMNSGVDNDFEFKKYTYMCRGGEIYYLHLLHAFNADTSPSGTKKRKCIEDNLMMMLHAYPQFSALYSTCQGLWNMPAKKIDKSLVTIPLCYQECDAMTVSEMATFLDSAIHPFEKMDMLATGIGLQLMRLIYHASDASHKGAWVIDLSESIEDNREMRKLSVSEYSKCEAQIETYIYWGYNEYKKDYDPSKKKKDIKSAEDDSRLLFRKLGKTIGLVVPYGKGAGTRFTFSEGVIKFLVLAIVKPKGKITLDTFAELLYDHYGMIIGPKEYETAAEAGSVPEINDTSFLQTNLLAFSQRLKDCGFLRDLSDATSIVENPYEAEEHCI